MSGNVHHAFLAARRPLARDVVELDFALESEDTALTWRSGQFISITVGHNEDGTPILRSYSIASRPDGRGFKLVLKLVQGGAASSWFRDLPEGERVRFTGPMGFFVLDLQHAGDAVFAATGTGLAPILPMIEDLLGRNEAGRAHLFFGVRDEGDIFWRDEIDRLARASNGKLSSTISLTRPEATWSGGAGRINSHIYEALPSLHKPTFYLCGNGAMIREVKAALIERGVDRKRQIRTEAFFD